MLGSIKLQAGDFNAQSVGDVAWAFANAGRSDEALFKALARAAEQGIGEEEDPEEDLIRTL